MNGAYYFPAGALETLTLQPATCATAPTIGSGGRRVIAGSTEMLPENGINLVWEYSASSRMARLSSSSAPATTTPGGWASVRMGSSSVRLPTTTRVGTWQFPTAFTKPSTDGRRVAWRLLL